MSRVGILTGLGILLLGCYLVAHGAENTVSPSKDMSVTYGETSKTSLRKMEHRFGVIDRRRQDQPLPLLRLLERTSSLPHSAVRHAFVQRVGEFKGTAWIMIAPGRICIAHLARAGAACDRPGPVHRRGIAVGLFQAPKSTSKKPTGFLVAGIAPDGKNFVQLMIGKRRLRRPIHHNFYAAASAIPITVLGLER